MSKQCFGSVLVLVACLAGCGKRPAPLPTTYPVHGKATYRDGTPLAGGSVQFLPEADRSVTTNGEIGGDGTYRLTTMRDGLRAEGAVAGPNRVIVVTSPNTVTPIILPAPYNVASRDNEFNLTVERPTGAMPPRPQ
jgi:hypothetical protein